MKKHREACIAPFGKQPF